MGSNEGFADAMRGVKWSVARGDSGRYDVQTAEGRKLGAVLEHSQARQIADALNAEAREDVERLISWADAIRRHETAPDQLQGSYTAGRYSVADELINEQLMPRWHGVSAPPGEAEERPTRDDWSNYRWTPETVYGRRPHLPEPCGNCGRPAWECACQRDGEEPRGAEGEGAKPPGKRVKWWEQAQRLRDVAAELRAGTAALDRNRDADIPDARLGVVEPVGEAKERALQCWCRGVGRSHDWDKASGCPDERVFLADASPTGQPGEAEGELSRIAERIEAAALAEVGAQHWSLLGQIEAAISMLQHDHERGLGMLQIFVDAGWPEARAYGLGKGHCTEERLALCQARGYQVATILAESDGDPDLMREIQDNPFEWRKRRQRLRDAEADDGGDPDDYSAPEED